MHDIRVRFNGEYDTVFDLKNKVEGKDLYMQKYMINLATDNGSDPLYSTRGTTLMQEAIGGILLSDNAIAHAGNFAALDSRLFVTGEEYSAVRLSPDLVTDCILEAQDTDNNSGTITYNVRFTFADGTETDTTLNI